jgi:hypothetical protein
MNGRARGHYHSSSLAGELDAEFDVDLLRATLELSVNWAVTPFATFRMVLKALSKVWSARSRVASAALPLIDGSDIDPSPTCTSTVPPSSRGNSTDRTADHLQRWMRPGSAPRCTLRNHVGLGGAEGAARQDSRPGNKTPVGG